MKLLEDWLIFRDYRKVLFKVSVVAGHPGVPQGAEALPCMWRVLGGDSLCLPWLRCGRVCPPKLHALRVWPAMQQYFEVVDL